MADEKLVNYIEKHIKKGIKPERIKSALLKAGHDSGSIEKAFTHAHSRKNLTKVGIVTAVVVLLLFVVLYQTDLGKVSESQIKDVTPANVDDELLLNDAISTLDESKCREIQNPDLIETCLSTISESKDILISAINNLDKNECYEIKNEDLINICLEGVSKVLQ